MGGGGEEMKIDFLQQVAKLVLRGLHPNVTPGSGSVLSSVSSSAVTHLYPDTAMTSGTKIEIHSHIADTVAVLHTPAPKSLFHAGFRTQSWQL